MNHPLSFNITNYVTDLGLVGLQAILIFIILVRLYVMDPLHHQHAALRQIASNRPNSNPAALRPLRLGDIAPDFTATTTWGTLNFHRFIGNSWVLFFSHPADFTPVCTTEIGELARRVDEWKARNVKLLGISIGSVEEHLKWIEDMKSIYKIEGDFPFPMVADDIGMVASLYGMVDSPNHDPTNVRRYSLIHMPLTVRSVFIIDPSRRIRAIWTYPASTGRNLDEMLRVLDSIQLTDRAKISTPVNWVPGDEVIIRQDVTPEEANILFPNSRKLTPYLIYTKLAEDSNKPGSINETR